MKVNQNSLTPKQKDDLLKTLKNRFEKNTSRHKGIEWKKVNEKLEASPGKLWSLNEMENTGGEPDVIGYDKKTGEFIFYDCAAESPAGRRSLCYDRQALNERKENKPKGSAQDMAREMGMGILKLQRKGKAGHDFSVKGKIWLNKMADGF